MFTMMLQYLLPFAVWYGIYHTVNGNKHCSIIDVYNDAAVFAVFTVW